MDLGICGRRAIVSGASKGLGRACAYSLAREGVSLAIVARTQADIARRPVPRNFLDDYGIRKTARP